MSVLGLYDGHNAGAALLSEDGSVLAAVEEERFSRIKNHDARPGHDGAPNLSIAYCLDMANGSVSRVAYGIQEPKRLQEIVSVEFNRSLASGELQRLDRAKELGLGETQLRTLPLTSQEARVSTLRAALQRAGHQGLPECFVDHHEAHAGGAFLFSGAPTALVITLDGKGDGLSGTVSVGAGSNLERVLSITSEASLGHLYSAFTVACGFRPQRDEGKLQALAASGGENRHLRDWLEKCYPWDEEAGTFRGHLNRGLVVGPYPDRRPEQHNYGSQSRSTDMHLH